MTKVISSTRDYWYTVGIDLWLTGCLHYNNGAIITPHVNEVRTTDLERPASGSRLVNRLAAG